MPLKVQEELKMIVDKLKEEKGVKEIYLFGSYAYGTPNEDSDLDICFIAKDIDKTKHDIMKSLRRSIMDIQTMPMDLLIYYEDEFKNRSSSKFTMEYEILTKGLKLYG